MAADDTAYPRVECPQCGAEQEDLDGFGVLYCAKCGYCQHPSIDGEICGLCGRTVTEKGA